MLPLQLNLLGGFEARLGAESVIIARRKAQALLAYLAVEPERPHLRDKLAALLWGDTTNGQARHSLRQALLAIKQAVPQRDLISVSSDTVTLNHAGLRTDVAAFERLLADGGAAALMQAAGLYRGEFLEGLSVQESRFEDWLMTQRERLRELAVDVLGKLLALHIQRDSTDQAVHTATRLLSLDPLQESVHRTLMRLYAQQGRRGVALRQYQACVDIMQRELGVEPEAKTRALYQEILEEPPPTAGVAAAPLPVAAGAPLGNAGGVAAVGRPTPLIGRTAELAALRQIWEQARRQQQRVAVILGDAGIGKTRLVNELAAEVSAQGGRVLIGRAHESEQILPFGPWVDALRSGHVLAELGAQGEASTIWMTELARLFPELGTPMPESRDSEDYGRLFEAIGQVMSHLARRQPLVVILEDLHWADEMSLRLLPSLIRRVSGAPVLLLATARSEHVIDTPILRRMLAEANRDLNLLSLPVAPLSQNDTLALVRTLCRVGTNDPTVQRLGAQIWRVSEGNPFMVVETMRGLYEDNVDHSTAELRTPSRVHDVIAARLERLSQRGRDLAAVAAVIGREFDFALLARAAGASPNAAAEGVEELVARRILHVVDERLDFTHDRIREVTYDRVLAPRRQLLHAAVARAIEELYAGDLTPHYTALSIHCRHGQLWEKASLYSRNAGSIAVTQSAHRQAMACFEQALDALRHLPNDPKRLEATIDLRFALRNSCVAVGALDQVPAHLDDAEAAAAALGDRLRLGWVLAYRTSASFLLGRNDRAMEFGRRALHIAHTLADPKLRIAAHIFVAQVCYAVGRYQEGAALVQENLATLEGELAARGDKPAQQIYSRSLIGCCLAELGDFDAGRTFAVEAIRIAESANRNYALSHACFTLGLLHLRQGAFSDAIPVLEHGLHMSDARDVPLLAAGLSGLLGYGYALAGNLDRGVPILTDAVDLISRHMRGGTHSLLYLAEAELLRSRFDDAHTLAEQAIALSRTRAERGFEAWGLRLLAEAQCHTAPTEAATAYGGALTLAEALGMKPLRALCHLGRGRLHTRTGCYDRASADLRNAVDLFRSMQMHRWLPEAENELLQLERTCSSSLR